MSVVDPLESDAPVTDPAVGRSVQRRRRAVRTVLRVAFLCAVLGFGVYEVRRQYHQVRQGLHELTWWSVLLGLALAEISIWLSMLSWRRVLADLGSTLGLRPAARVYFVSQLGKYLPGSVWPVLAQMEMARDHAVPRSRTGAAALVAIGLGLVGTLVVAGALLPFAVQDTGWRIVVIAGLVLSLFAASPPVLNRFLSLGLRLLRRPPLEHPLSARGLLAALGFAVASWALQGLAVYVFALPLLGGDGSPARLLALAVGGYAVASAAGIIVIIAPAGLGVREPALLAALSSEVATGSALVVVLVIRLAVTVADLLTGGVLAMLPSGRAGRAVLSEAKEPG